MTLFLDACIVIYWIEAPDPFHARLMDRLRQLRKRAADATFAVSRLSWLECVVKPLRESNQTLIDDYRSFFEASELRVIELTAPVVEHASVLSASHGLRIPDALQAASAFAVHSERTLFLTNDRAFRKVTGLTVEIPA